MPKTLNQVEVSQLLESEYAGRPFPYRDRAMLELFYASGLRISELAGARLENLNLQERIIRVIGKGSKTRLVPVGRIACESIDRYLTQERVHLVGKKNRKRGIPVAAREETDDATDLADLEGDCGGHGI